MYFKRQSLRRSVTALSAILFVLLVLSISTVSAQTTAFTYQGRFTDTTVAQPTNGVYDFQFVLYDALTDGSVVGTNSTATTNITVTNGIFTVELDFGATAFSGAERYLEIRVQRAGVSAPFTTLVPRQQLTSTPYATRSLTATNAERLGNTAANQFVRTTDARLSDARTPVSGSSNYIQNTTSRQQNANFSISGNGVIEGELIVNGLLRAVLGQESETVYGTGGLTVTRTVPIYILVPGLRQTVTVTTGYNLSIATDGGIQTLSTTSDGVSFVDVAIFVNGSILSSRQHQIENGRITQKIVNWNLSLIQGLPSGTYTVEVRARSAVTDGLSNAVVSGGGSADNILRGQLTTTLVRK